MKQKVRKQRTSHETNGGSAKRRLNPKKFAIAILVVFFAIYFVYIMIWQQMTINLKNNEIDALNEKIEDATAQTEKLKAELENLDDPEYLEKIARERLGLIRSNERVFVDANKSESNTSE